MFKVDCKKSDTIEYLKQILVSSELLLRFDISKTDKVITLTIQNESEKGEFTLYGDNRYNKMMEFLIEFKNNIPTYLQNDVDCLIEEMEELEERYERRLI